jgi:hypothetical protein
MARDRHERLMLEWVRRCRDQPPTVPILLGRQLPRLLVMLIGCGLIIVWVVYQDQPGTAMLCGGMLVGVLLERLAVCLDIVRAWPTWNKFLDWDRVDAALESESDAEGPR